MPAAADARGDSARYPPWRLPPAALFITSISIFACSGGTQWVGSHEHDECAPPSAPPAELGLDPFYAKYVDAHGVPIVSSTSVSDTALDRACDAAVHLLGRRTDVHQRLLENGLRFAVIGRNELVTDIPEYLNLDVDSAEARVLRSVGATSERPLSSAGEENLLCLSDDLFPGEALVVYSLAHGLRRLGIVSIDPDWEVRLRAAYADSIAAGLWANTYAAKDVEQYFAEGVQSFFDANQERVPGDGIHNEINTRRELEAYDPTLASLIAEYVADGWQPECLAGR